MAMSQFSEARPWTCKVTKSSRPQPIILIQPLVVKITNLSDVCVIRNNLLLALAENWRLALDCVARILLEVNNFFLKLFFQGPQKYQISWKLGENHYLSANLLASRPFKMPFNPSEDMTWISKRIIVLDNKIVNFIAVTNFEYYH